MSSIDQRTRASASVTQSVRGCSSGPTSGSALSSRARRAGCSVHRYYDPGSDQFLSVDPAIATTGQAYAFANYDPLNVMDPLGLYGSSFGFSDSFFTSIDYIGAYGQAVQNNAPNPAVSAYLAAAYAQQQVNAAVSAYLSAVYQASQAAEKSTAINSYMAIASHTVVAPFLWAQICVNAILEGCMNFTELDNGRVEVGKPSLAIGVELPVPAGINVNGGGFSRGETPSDVFGTHATQLSCTTGDGVGLGYNLDQNAVPFGSFGTPGCAIFVGIH